MIEVADEKILNDEAVEEEVKETSEAESVNEEAAETTEEKEAAVESDKKEEKKKKKDKDSKKTDALKEKIEELEDRTKRQMAEFDNFRKRTEREKATMFDMGERSVIEKILPIVDNFERGLKTVPEEEAESGFANGMNMIYKQLIDELDKLGVKPIEAVGQPFDPNFHNAVMQVEKEDMESGTVAEEFQKGYTFKDVVIRHSMVSVVQ
ncbi:MAG: nucleotide exchange factor GrpE [Lachnospiraceae bacterium]|nr:nucleotide exchange factor GrpE [Lachnospiraceae bacterium]